MYSTKRLSDIFELEIFLFGGVPETAEQMHEREFHCYSEPRLTRQELAPMRPAHDADDKAEVVHRLRIQVATGEVTVLTASGEAGAASSSSGTKAGKPE